MSLPVLEEVPRKELKEQLRNNVKASPKRGISNLGKPGWLKIRPPKQQYHELRKKLGEEGLVTVCQESHCPNMSECWSSGTATFMVMGDTCTRTCKFCNVKARGNPEPLDEEEPEKLVKAVGEMKLDYVVITSVDRDDLPDGGAGHFARCIKEIKNAYPGLLIEVLIPDFQGDEQQLLTVLRAGPDVLAHNLETVRRLQASVRDARANYDQSLGVLKRAKELRPGVKTKTSIMLGLGETKTEVHEAMDDLRRVGCDVVTFGQYLQPSSWHLAVERYWTPQEFKELETTARQKGFIYCASGPFVRSSYRAGELLMKGMLREVSD